MQSLLARPLSYLPPHFHRNQPPGPSILHCHQKGFYLPNVWLTLYGISCGRCPAIFIGGTGSTLRQRFGEHPRNIEKKLPSFPVAEHFNAAGYFIAISLFVNFALRRDLPAEAAGDAPDFQTRHQLSERLNSDFRALYFFVYH